MGTGTVQGRTGVGWDYALFGLSPDTSEDGPVAPRRKNSGDVG